MSTVGELERLTQAPLVAQVTCSIRLTNIASPYE